MNLPLLKKVRAAVLRDYRHVDMNNFLYTKTSTTDQHTSPTPEVSCGMVGCIAGHAILQSGIDFKMIRRVGKADLGQALLGLTKAQAEVFYFHDEATPLGRELRKLEPGTKAYAKVVAKAIDKLIEEGDSY